MLRAILLMVVCLVVLMMQIVLIAQLRAAIERTKEAERRQRLVEQDAFRPRGWLDAMHRHYDGLD